MKQAGDNYCSLGYIVQARAYKSTSLLLEILTRDHGRVACIASGGRGNLARWQNLLQPFSLLEFQWRKRETQKLASLQAVTACEKQNSWHGLKFAMAMYLNELIFYLLPQGQGDQALFLLYRQVLSNLAIKPQSDKKAESALQLELLLRQFEYQLLIAIGYGVVLQHDDSGNAICPDQYYWLRLETLPRLWYENNQRPSQGVLCRGSSLLALTVGRFETKQDSQELKKLMKMYLNFYLGPKHLRSRELFQKFKVKQQKIGG